LKVFVGRTKTKDKKQVSWQEKKAGLSTHLLMKADDDDGDSMFEIHVLAVGDQSTISRFTTQES
jgi:hypothetical protein